MISGRVAQLQVELSRSRRRSPGKAAQHVLRQLRSDDHRRNFGVPFHGRSADESTLFGFKSEVLPLRIDLNPEQRFCDLVQQVHERLRETLKYRGISIDNPGHRPVIHAQSNFIFQRTRQPQARFPVSRIEFPRHSAQPEAVHFLQFNDAAIPGGMKCVLSTHSAAERFTDGARLSGGYVNALESLLADPLQTVRDIPFIDPDSQAFFARCETTAEELREISWLSRWAASAGSLQLQAVVIHEETTLTHAELRDEAGRWVAFFRARGLQAGNRVIVSARTSTSLAAVVTALFSCNLTYVPMRPGIPPEQLLETVNSLQAACVLMDPVPANADPTRLGPLSDNNGEVQRFALDKKTVARFSPATLEDPDPDRIAHIFHTSGSTGRPKPIAVTHRALATFVNAWISANHMQPGEVIFHFYAITFDPWLSTLLPALILGGTCVSGDQQRPPHASTLASILNLYKVTTLCTPTAYFHALRDFTTPRHVQRWIVGGEALESDKAMSFLRKSPHTALVNAYGPTETTVWASICHITPAHAQAMPIGRPLPSCGFRVCDESGRHMPFGVPGELWIRGTQLAEGYVGQPELTDNAFVALEGSRWYRTGDLVRWRKDGDLDFLGRLDRQIKIRGHRVEPGEIEVVLRAMDDILDAVVAPLETEQGPALCAWIIPAHPGSPPMASSLLPSSLKAALLRTLPDYKIPRWFMQVDAFPRNHNGKIAVDLLPRPQASEDAPQDDRLPSLTLWDLRFIFEKTLNVDRSIRVSVDDNFFDLGGDSLRLIELLGEIEAHFGKRLEPTEVIDHPTIGQLAPLLEERREKAAKLVVELKPGNGPPLWCIPGAGGIGVEFYPIARRLEGDHSVWVLRSTGTDGHAHPPESLGQLLNEHVENILAHRHATAEQRPVHLAGYSLGGVFAWEVAQRLHARGVPVGNILLIDAHAGTAEGRKLFAKPRTTLRDRFFRRSSTERRNRINALKAELDAALSVGQMMAPAPLGEYNGRVQATLSRNVNAVSGPFNTIYVKASRSDRHPQIELWRKLAARFTVETVEGDHEGDNAIIREPRVARLAEIVSKVLRTSR